MRNFVHPTAVLGPTVQLSDGVEIGPFCVIGLPDYQKTSRKTKQAESAHAFAATIIEPGCQIYSHSYIGIGTSIGPETRVDSHGYVGSRCRIESSVTIEYGARIYNDVTVGTRSTVSGFVCNSVSIGSDCEVHGSLVHARRGPGMEAAPILEEGVFVGTGAIVIGGVRLFRSACLAAGSVLTRDAASAILYKGNPARPSGPSPNWR